MELLFHIWRTAGVWEDEGVWKVGVPVGKTGVSDTSQQVKIWGALLPWVADSRLPQGDLSNLEGRGFQVRFWKTSCFRG